MSIYKNGKLIAGGSQALPLLSFMWADHVLNHPSWLRADTFSWQPGRVYIAAYQHFAADITGKTLQSETISGTTIQFYLADDGHKICPASQESNVTAIYNATGVAWYYIIDTTNQRFKLPRQAQKKNYHGQIIERRANGVRWAEIYSDGWVRQGGNTDNTNFLVTMANTSYSALLSPRKMYAGERTVGIQIDSKSTTSISVSAGWEGSASRDWTVEGWSTITSKEVLLESQKHLYFYMGNFTQTALENTAGLNAELFNGKADLNLSNTASNIDFVVERQEPTAANGYTWYRKYKSGWVEQGGYYSGNIVAGSSASVSIPVVMADTNYACLITGEQNSNNWAYGVLKNGSRTTTGFQIHAGGGGSSDKIKGACWQVSGMAAN